MIRLHFERCAHWLLGLGPILSNFNLCANRDQATTNVISAIKRPLIKSIRCLESSKLANEIKERISNEGEHITFWIYCFIIFYVFLIKNLIKIKIDINDIFILLQFITWRVWNMFLSNLFELLVWIQKCFSCNSLILLYFQLPRERIAHRLALYTWRSLQNYFCKYKRFDILAYIHTNKQLCSHSFPFKCLSNALESQIEKKKIPIKIFNITYVTARY